MIIFYMYNHNNNNSSSSSSNSNNGNANVVKHNGAAPQRGRNPSDAPCPDRVILYHSIVDYSISYYIILH